MSQVVTDNLIISSGGVSASISGTSQLLKEIKSNDFLVEYIPDLTFPVEVSNLKTFEIISDNNPNMRFELTNSSARIYADSDTGTKDVISLIEYALEYWRQAEGIYCIHGAACAYNDIGILIIGGASGIGKSTLVKELCKDPAFRFIGDEKVLIRKNGELVGGINNLDSTKLDASQPGPKTKLVVQPVMAPGGDLIVVEWDDRKANWHLYEELSRKIRGTSRRINASIPVQSIDTEDIAVTRSEAATQMSDDKTISFLTVYGDVSLVGPHIKKRIEDKLKA